MIQRKRLSSVVHALFVVSSAFALPAAAQSVNIAAGIGSGTPGSVVNIPINLASSGGAQAAGLQWTLTYSGTDVSNIAITASSPVIAASKTLSYCLAGPCVSPVTVIIFGFTSAVVPDGTVATASFTISPTSTATSIPIQVTSTSATTSGATGIPATGTNGNITVIQPTASLTGVSCSPGSVNAPGTSACTVTLSGNAASPQVVTLGSNNGTVTVPANVTVATGQSTSNFTATVASTGTDQTAVITATLGSASPIFSLGVVAPALVTGLSCSPTSLASNSSSTCTVTVNKSTGTTVALNSNNGLLTVPQNVAVLSGNTTATFQATAGVIPSGQSATVTASVNGSSAPATISLNAPSQSQLSSLTCNPSPVIAPGTSTCTVSLTAAAPSTQTIGLSSNNGNVTVPGSVQITTGQISTTFQASVTTVGSSQSAILTANLNGTATFTLQVTGPAQSQVSGLTCNPGTVTGPGTSSCTVSLTAAAISTQTIGLSSNNGNVTLPAIVQIGTGQNSATFQANVGSVSANQGALLTASLNGTATFTLQITSPPQLSSLSCLPASLSAGQSATCTATLAQSASGTTTVTLSSDNGALTVPASAIVNSGSTTSTFLATAGIASTQQSATVSAFSGGVTKTAGVTVLATMQLSSLTCNPATINVPGSSTCTVSLAVPASPAQTITIASANGNVSVPPTVQIPAGQTSATFQASAGTVNTDQPAALSATLNAASQNFTLNLSAPAIVQSLSCNPTSLSSNTSATCTVALSKAAPASMSVALTSSQGPLTIPNSLNVAQGANSVNFTAVAGNIASNTTVNLTASANGGVAPASIGLVANSQLSGLSCTPNPVNAGASMTCTVTISGAAGSAQTVALSTDNSSLNVPPSMQIASGQNTGTFTASAGQVSTDQTVMVTAALNSTSQSVSVSINGPAQLSSATCAPNTLGGGATAICTVNLTRAALSVLFVSLSSDNPALSVPSNVSIAIGASSATFNATAGIVSTLQTANVVAINGSVTKTTTVTVSATVQLSQLACAPSSVNAPGTSTCTVSLTGPASGSQTIALSSANPSVSAPASIQIAPGASSATFPVSVASITSDQTAQLSATLSGATQNATLNLVAPPQLTGVICAPSSVPAGGITTCTVTLSKTNGVPTLVNLGSDSGMLAVPSSVLVNTGALSATFTATAGNPSSAQTANVSGANNGITKSAVVTVSAVTSFSLTCSATIVTAPSTINCSVGFAGSGTIALSSNNPHLSVPQSVPQTLNQAANFNAAAVDILSDEFATITAVMNGQTQNITVTLVAGAHLSAIACAPSDLNAGNTTTCTVSLTKNTTSNVSLTLGSSSSALAVPAALTIPSGQISAAFQGIAAPISAQQSVMVQAVWNGNSVQTPVVVHPAGAPVLTVPTLVSRPINTRVHFSISAADPNNLSVVLSATGLPVGASFNPATGVFDWPAPNTALGSYQVTFQAVNSANVASTRVTIITIKTANLPVIGVFNAANFSQQDICSPGSSASLFSGGLSGLPPASDQSATLPMQLAGVTLQINDEAVPLFYVSDSLINFQCPMLPPGTLLTIMADTKNGFTTPFTTIMRDATPGIYVLSNYGTTQGAVQLAGTDIIAMPTRSDVDSRPAQPGDYISIYANGLGVVDNPVPLGTPAPMSPLARTVNKVTAVVGGKEIQASFAGLTPGFPNLFVVNTLLPSDIATGNQVGLFLRVKLDDGTTFVSNLITIATQPKQ